MKKSDICIRILALVLALMLVVPDALSVSAATKGSVTAVSVTNLPAKTLTLKKGKTFTLKTKVTTTGSVSKKLTFKTSNKSVATVSSKGKITAKKKGTAKITVASKANSNKKVTITVTVGTPVTKVTMSAKTAAIGVGTTKKLSVTLTPKTPSNKTVVWSTSNKKIATVDSKGNVKGVKAGTATITATAADGSGKKATCKVTVKKAVTKVKLDETKMSLGVGKSKTLKATVTPDKALGDVKWTTSNEKVATVSSTGKVKGVKAGTATITATAADGSGKKATCKVTVKKAVTKVKLNKTELNIFVGKSETLKATVTPEAAFDDVEWTTSNKEIATVSSTGKVKGVKAGTATITVTAADGSGKKATCKVVVTTPVESVALSETAKTVKKGEVFSLTATVTPDKATSKAVEWSSSDENVAIVTAKGKVSAVGAGTATITAAAADGSGKSASCNVTVLDEVGIVSAVTSDKTTIEVTMSEPMDLNAEQFSVMTKQNMQGTYETDLSIGSVTSSADKRTYTIKLDKKNRMKDGWFIKVAVTGIRGTEQAEIETYYSDGNKTTAENQRIDIAVGEFIQRRFGLAGYERQDIADITVDTLPEGLNYKQSRDYEGDVLVYGTPAEAGVVRSVLSITYEDGMVATFNITWYIQQSGKIFGYVEPQNLVLIEHEDGKYVTGYTDLLNSVSGGSSEYTYKLVEDDGQEVAITEYGDLSVTLREARDYLIKVEVTDKNDPSMSTVIPVEFHVSDGIRVSGCVKDPQGNSIEGATIEFFVGSKVEYYDFSAQDGTYAFYVPAGTTYDIKATYNGAGEWIYNQTFTAAQDNVDFTLPVYQVKIEFDNTFEMSNEVSWLDMVGDAYGSGQTLYLASGTYDLKAEGFKEECHYTASLQVTVEDKPVTVKAKVTKKPLDLISITSGDGQEYTIDEETWFKFVPEQTGSNYWYSLQVLTGEVDLEIYTGEWTPLHSGSWGTGAEYNDVLSGENVSVYYIRVQPMNTVDKPTITMGIRQQ